MTKRFAALIAAAAGSIFMGGCTATTQTRVVEPAPVAIQRTPVATERTTYPDGTYVDRPVVATTAAPVVTATTTTTPVVPATTTVYTTRY
jgi:hypothetical protein